MKKMESLYLPLAPLNLLFKVYKSEDINIDLSSYL